MNISVIGAGSWGSAIAWLLGEKGHTVRLWARSPQLVSTLNASHRNPRYLQDITFAPTVTASTSLAETLANTEAVVLVTPSAVVSNMAQQIAPLISQDTPVVLLSKGLEPTQGSLLLDVLASDLYNGEPDESASLDAAPAPGTAGALIPNPANQIGPSEHFGWPDNFGSHGRLAVLSGPNHAEEVVRSIPSATVVASLSQETADFFQTLFATPTFRVYTSRDTIGVQLCGAAKNIIAIACGLATGLGFGDNTTSMLMTRGLAEISRLAASLGGDPLTCMGLAGMGDLIATCTSTHSRNRAFGLELAGGGTLEAYQERTHMVVEGAIACKTVTNLAYAHNVDMPISMVVRNIVWDRQPLDEAVTSLIDRSFKPEFP
ncbi:MAG: NAD(P)-dependent glycerol-3-phosphate dehydrogenase [Coriobacteriales bacterium]|jgi:glycerol-3-phosphate dehydrogenase (NAD(P)+)|nr:NAD(P)-dependent glycerol-3-phosphate dehydrogenase [Coriobacteriales bacterium]